MKLYTIDRNPQSKNPFVGGQNPTIHSPTFPFFTPVMHALSMARSEHHSFEPCYCRGGLGTAANESKGLAFRLRGKHLLSLSFRASQSPDYCADRILAEAWRKQVMWGGGGGHQLPLPTPSLSLPLIHSFLSVWQWDRYLVPQNVILY